MSSADFPYLSLKWVTVDPAVSRRLPRRLAYYYLALPIAHDGDDITVVMAYPDNPNIVTVLQSHLGAHVVPVRGSAPEIKSTLDLLWSAFTDPAESEPAAPRILSWGMSYERAALAKEFAALMAKALRLKSESGEPTCLDASQNSLETAVTLAREGRYTLTVADSPKDEALAYLLRESSSPVLLVRGPQLEVRRILLVLRVGSPDQTALDWVIPLAVTGGAEVTLLAVASSSGSGKRKNGHPAGAPKGLVSLLLPETTASDHVAACAHRVLEAGLRGNLRLRQGVLEREIAAEAAESTYDLIAIAAEAQGDFVQRVLHELERLVPNDERPVLVVKPMAV